MLSPRYCEEDIRYLKISNLKRMAYPMKCFCDINIHKLTEHLDWYGYYGLAFSKEWGMGLTAYKGAKVRRGDVTIAKNYMSHEEISTLNLIVNMYLDYAELQAKGHNPMHMSDWEVKLGEFLRFNGREVLENLGTVKREEAEKLALEQYELYDAHRRALEATDDVDELTENVKRLKP